MIVPSWFIKLFKRASLAVSKRREVVGVPVWHLLPVEPKATEELARVTQAIELIARTDPRRFGRLRSDLRGIWIVGSAGAGEYESHLQLCALDPSYILRADVTVPDIAATIVHEATHARLWACGFRYDQAIRPRIERVCIKAEIAFAARLQDGVSVVRRAEYKLTRVHDAWTDHALRAQTVRRLRQLGAPNWMIRSLEKRDKPTA